MTILKINLLATWLIMFNKTLHPCFIYYFLSTYAAHLSGTNQKPHRCIVKAKLVCCYEV